MTPSILIQHVDDSIAKATRHQSWIDESVLSLTGFATGVMRRMVSNICHLPKANPAYLEVGLFGGATFCAAMSNNPTLTAIGVENFSQPFGKEGIRQELEANIEKYRLNARFAKLINSDCFTVRMAEIPLPIDVYYFDGEHSFESQAKALPYYFDALAPLFVFMVDDAHWSSVHEGTIAGFETLKDRVKIEKSWALDGVLPQDDPVFWNGMELFVCSKK